MEKQQRMALSLGLNGPRPHDEATKIVDLRAELLSEGVLTLDGLRWSDGTAWCELRSASGPGPAALNIRYLWATECGKGYGTALLKKIIRVADRLGAMLYLEVSPFWKKRGGGGWCFETVREGGLNRAQLEAWYQKYGFEKINGSAMVRKANAPAHDQNARPETSS